jgi:peptidoglycan/LPS O-acetylase OafA/YrhL
VAYGLGGSSPSIRIAHDDPKTMTTVSHGAERDRDPEQHAAPPPVVAPPPGHPRFPLLDALRAIAVLAVLLTHTSFLSGSNERAWYGDLTARLDVGVTIFFVISGFLIYRPFVHTRLNGAPATPITTFFRRRFLRIFPAYWAALTLLAVAPGLPDVHTGRWWVYYGLFQAYDPGWFDKGIGTAWSLSTEVAFYALLPLYAVTVARLRSVKVELALIGTLAIGSVLARGLVAHADMDAAFGQASTFPLTIGGTFLWFALGMSLAVLSASLHDRPPPAWARAIGRRPWIPWAFAAAAFLLVSEGVGISGARFEQHSVAQSLAEYVLYGVVALGLLLPAVFGDAEGGWPRRILATRWLAALGLVSYGVFLWHLTIATKLAGERVDGFVPLTLLTLLTAVPIAAVSYVVLERPLLRLKYRPSRSASR